MILTVIIVFVNDLEGYSNASKSSIYVGYSIYDINKTPLNRNSFSYGNMS